MIIDRRKKNVNWMTTSTTGELYPEMRDGVMLAVLMDIRDELQKLNSLLHCSNFVGIPATLRGIQRKMPTPRKKRAA